MLIISCYYYFKKLTDKDKGNHMGLNTNQGNREQVDTIGARQVLRQQNKEVRQTMTRKEKVASKENRKCNINPRLNKITQKPRP